MRDSLGRRKMKLDEDLTELRERILYKLVIQIVSIFTEECYLKILDYSTGGVVIRPETCVAIRPESCVAIRPITRKKIVRE